MLFLIAVLPAAAEAPVSEGAPFRISGKITYIREAPEFATRVISVENATNAVALHCSMTALPDCPRIRLGDLVDCTGQTRQYGDGTVITSATACEITGHGRPEEPVNVTIPDLLDGRHDYRLTRFQGTLRDITSSETAPRWIILVICGDRDRIFVSVPASDGTRERLSAFLGLRVSVVGICAPSDPSRRLKSGRTFKVATETSIRTVENESSATADIPDVNSIQLTRLSDILALGRHAATGRIVAVWNGSHALLKQDDGKIVDLELAQTPPPLYGERVRAVGLPESDLFRINLVHVAWTRLAPPSADDSKAIPISPKNITHTRQGYELIDTSYHGQPVSIDGVVRSIPDDESHLIHVECNGALVPVNASAEPALLEKIGVGYRIRACGTCVIEHEERHQSSAFPRLKGFLIVLRTPADITILAHPPWWTPARLLGVIGTLLAVLVGILIWNTALRRLAIRKGRELMREQIGHVKAKLKTEERTRLAVELHDSLAQNLTGVSLEIDTAAKVADEDHTAMMAHLGVASRALKSCRDELRNCLWDLRNRALEEDTMDAAIRQTLAPHAAGVEVSVRFNVPRARISDNTAHAILRIIRELALNGIRHGGATKIRVAGSIEGDRMLFSVRDNGRGFDPDSAPGFADGHYGLLGIRERVDEFEGDFTVSSAPGTGTKAMVSLRIPQEAPHE